MITNLLDSSMNGILISHFQNIAVLVKVSQRDLVWWKKTIIEVSKHGTALVRDHESIKLKNKEDSIEIPIEKIEAIIITANVLVSSQVIKLCNERQIQMVFANYAGIPYARIWNSSFGKTSSIRRQQYLNQNTNFSLNLSRKLVVQKIKRQKNFVRELKNNRSTNLPQIDDLILKIDEQVKKLEDLNMPVIDKNQLRGIEGNIAKSYFEVLSCILPAKWKFDGRSQHPAKDEFNAALNYAYGIGYSTVEKIIILSGLDPTAGFFHSDAYGKPVLSFDLIEVFRPYVDKAIFPLFTKNQARDNWFEKDITDIVYLSKEGRKNVLICYRESVEKKIELELWEFCKRIIKELAEL